MDWILENAKQFSDFIALVGVIATGGVWVARRVMLSIKRLDAVLKTQATLVSTVADIATQLKPNGGSSLFDLVKDAKKKSDENGKSLAEITDSVAKMRAYQWVFAETVTDKPVFEANEHGQCTRVNSAYAKLAERNSPELLGNGWENFIHFSDRVRVFDEWEDAVRRKRIFESKYKVTSSSGKTYSIKSVAMPVLDDNGKVTAYVGRFDEVKEVPSG